jgi:putative ABC transport system permease protein
VVGYMPPLDIPWDRILLGVAIIVGITLLSSLWPAAQAAREEPLSLLQAGRAGT